MKTLIKNGRVIDPAQNLDKKADVLLEKGKIKQIAANIKDKDAKHIIDAQGKIVAPGFIDMHTHLREPGEEYKETIASGAKAAIKGGFTTVCAMPNTKPACDNEAQVRFVLEQARNAKFANILPIGAITQKREGKEMAPMAELKAAGCIAISDDGDTVENPRLMRRVMEYASMLDLLIIDHAEDKCLSGNGVMHEGYWSTALGLAPIPAEAETTIIDRNIQLAELTDARIHIAHISTAKGIDIVRKAKKRGVKVTTEVTPHHFSLTDEALQSYDSNFKMKPPLRSKEDVLAVKKALKDGTIDAIATDHAPHGIVDKLKEFDYAAFGIIGLETALPLAVMKLIDKGYLDWPGLIRKLATNPASILGYDKGTLAIGKDADIVIIEPETKWTYTEDVIVSLSHNSPFIDWELKGAVSDVFVAGRHVVNARVVV